MPRILSLASYRDSFSRILLRLVESGRLHMLRERWWNAKARCLSEQMGTTMANEGACKEMAFILGTRQMGKLA